MDVHAIVTRLRDLSKDPQNRSAIAKDEASLSGTFRIDLLCQVLAFYIITPLCALFWHSIFF